MKLPRVRFTVRRLMVAVALLAAPLSWAAQARRWSVISHARRDQAEAFEKLRDGFEKRYYKGGGSQGQIAYYQDMYNYYRLMEKKYRLAMVRPWESVPPDPPMPREPW